MNINYIHMTESLQRYEESFEGPVQEEAIQSYFRGSNNYCLGKLCPSWLTTCLAANDPSTFVALTKKKQTVNVKVILSITLIYKFKEP